ncbi:MAG: ABC transporter substrate-binding protein [bacterium]
MNPVKYLVLALAFVLASCGGGSEIGSSGLYEVVTYEANDAGLATESPVEGGASNEFGGCVNRDFPQAIVSMSPTATEMLFAMGAGEQVIAVDNYSYWPPEAPVVEDLAGWNPNVEAIAAFEPDLVILSDSGIQQELELLGVEVYVAAAAVVLEDVFAQMFAIGEITCQRVGALVAVADMREKIAELLNGIERPENPLTYYHELDDTLYSVTSATFVGHIYSLAGLVNIADLADKDGSSWGYPQLTQEFVLEADPDIIFFADAECCGQSVEAITSRPGWSELKAVRNGNVIEMDNDVSSRWGPRLVDFLATVNAAISAVTAG